MMKYATSKRVLLAAVVAGFALAGGPATAAPLLRVCSDPDNLPFSAEGSDERGMYIELADLVAQQLGVDTQFVWSYSFNQRRALRATVLEDRCDAWFAVPAADDYRLRGMQRSKAFQEVGYAVVTSASARTKSLHDLMRQRIGVIYASTPALLLATEGGYTTITFRTEREAFDALERKEIDAAILWGPSAGYENKRRRHERWTLQPVTGNGMTIGVAVAIRSSDNKLRTDIDKALVDLAPQIQMLQRKYGFPMGETIRLSAKDTISSPSRATAMVGAGASGNHLRMLASATQSTSPVTKEPVGVRVADPIVGRTLFNNRCAHCHGTNAASPLPERDLRRLQGRYRDTWRDTTLTTILNGRPELGMPAWRDALTETDLRDLTDYLSTIQR